MDREMIKKLKICPNSFCCIKEIHLNIKDRHYLKGKCYKKIF